MSAGWVAGSVRARALAQHTVGPAASRRLAGSSSLAGAVRALDSSGYARHLGRAHDLAQAQHAVAAAVLWDLRVLAGWLPRGGVHLMRILAGWFEIANVDELLAELDGRPRGEMFRLGALATALTGVPDDVGSVAALRSRLAGSAWGDPGGSETGVIQSGLRARLAIRAASLGEPASSWAAGGLALLVAGERYTAGREPSGAVRDAARRLLGSGPVRAATLTEFVDRLPRQARWALAGTAAAPDLWLAESRWWARVEADGASLLGTGKTGSDVVLGAAAVLAADARRVRAALAMAERGGVPMDAYDAVA